MILDRIESRDQFDPYLIAEIGVNYFDIAEQRDIPPLEAAKAMIREASEAGADAVKFQSYSAEALATKRSTAYWDTDEEATETQYELFDQYDDFGATEFETISRWTNNNYPVDFLSTPFDFQAVDYLSDIVQAYKVASADITNHPLLRRIAREGKPVILSTGASTIGEIDDAVHVLNEEGSDLDLCLLHCVLQYPTDQENANLRMIEHLSDVYPEVLVGYSDHVPPDDGMVTLLNATFQGARIIEKHFTLDKTLEGNDHYHAADPHDIRTLVQNLDHLSKTAGMRRKQPISAEETSRVHARRSLVATAKIEEGEPITRDIVAIKRPGSGIPPSCINEVIGRIARCSIEEDEVISWDQV